MSEAVMNEVERIAPIRNEVEAQLLDAELTERDIPHVMKSYYDTAFDGVYQFSQGWGHVEAPPEFRDKILEILTSLRPKSSSKEDGSVEDPNDNSVS
ncbi:MAG: hypothetical protein ACYSUD_10555 [Planctomycetota bacterium]